MLYFIYETTNLINGKLYRGYHQTKNLNDNYKGSGKVLIRAFKNYGKINFKREILEFCISKEHMIEREKFYVDEVWKNRKDTYNLIVGGHSSGKIGHVNSEETRRKISEGLKKKYANGEIQVWNTG